MTFQESTASRGHRASACAVSRLIASAPAHTARRSLERSQTATRVADTSRPAPIPCRIRRTPTAVVEAAYPPAASAKASRVSPATRTGAALTLRRAIAATGTVRTIAGNAIPCALIISICETSGGSRAATTEMVLGMARIASGSATATSSPRTTSSISETRRVRTRPVGPVVTARVG
ncbi:hypothetical protein ACFQX6_58615 [Streptosporangium lutulentum]